MSKNSQIDQIRAELIESRDLTDQFLSSDANLQLIQQAAAIMSEALMGGHKIIACGNGGSHCDAMHFAEELTGQFRKPRKPLAAIAIAEPAYLSCVSNDMGFKQAFARYVEGLGNPGDILLAISTSGLSENVLVAMDIARSKNMKTISLTGHHGGKMSEKSDVCIIVPHHGFADRIQELHIKIIHILIFLIEHNTKTN